MDIKTLLSLSFAVFFFNTSPLFSQESPPVIEVPVVEDASATNKKAEESTIDKKIDEALKPISDEISKYVFAGVKIESKGEQLNYRNGDAMDHF
jgi:hypothetical protein